MVIKKNRRTRLEIKPVEMRKRLISLFDEIDKNEKTKGSFIKNPMDYIENKVMKQNLPPQQISEANRLLFSLFSNDEMVKWLKSYQNPTGSAKFIKRQFSQDFAKKVATLGDENIIISIISNATQGYGILGLADAESGTCVNHITLHFETRVCTPVDGKTISGSCIRPEMLRVLTANLINHAKELKREGILSNLEVMMH